MHIFQKGKHGLALAKQFCSAGYQDNINDSVAAWFPLCIKWLETQFHPFPADLENKIPTAQEAGVYSVTANTNSRPQFVRITGFSAASSTRQLTANNA